MVRDIVLEIDDGEAVLAMSFVRGQRGATEFVVEIEQEGYTNTYSPTVREMEEMINALMDAIEQLELNS